MLTYGGTEVQEVTYNGQAVEAITYNGVEVWVAAKPNLADNSWAVIKRIVDKGQAADYWDIGDTKNVTLNGTITAQNGENNPTTNFNYTISNNITSAVILGFDHNKAVESPNNHTVTFMIKDFPFPGTGYDNKGYAINLTNTQNGGWASSLMRTTTMQQVKALFPSDLKNQLKTITKYSWNGSDTPTATSEEVFLPSAYECLKRPYNERTAELSKVARYSYFDNNNLARNCWTRTATTSSDLWELSLDGAGNGGAGAIRSVNHIAPCFCL